MMAKIKKIKTRKSTTCPIFGAPKELDTRLLPTYESVMKCYLWWKHKLKLTGQEPKAADISDRVAIEIEEIWFRASIPVVSRDRVLKLIRVYHDSYRNLMKPYKGRHNNKSYLLK